MLDANDAETGPALRLLFDTVASKKKRLVIWVGAGASSWCDYPRWEELAERFHTHYLRYESRYEKNIGLGLLESHSYPELFQLCRDVNRHQFYKLLAESFPSKNLTPVYQRFLDTVSKIRPLFVLTTNVDELLEKFLPETITVQRSDIERVSNLVANGDSLVCKLHGSVSAIESTVFTSDDYAQLVSGSKYGELLREILSSTMILFIGYGLRDKYLLHLLAKNADLKKLFGDGPHFAVLSREHSELPENVRVIRYVPTPHRDHRSSIQVIEELVVAANQEAITVSEVRRATPSSIESAHLLFDVLPPGRWGTSLTANLQKDESGSEAQLVVGTGFSNAELPPGRPTAMHDLLVALLCFDTVYAPLFTLSRVYGMVGSETFWDLVNMKALRFVTWKHLDGIIFPSVDAVSGGDLGAFSRFNPDRTDWAVNQDIRLALEEVLGKEDVTDIHQSAIETRTRVIDPSEEGSISSAVRGLLLRPSVRSILGVSGGTPLNSFARWQAFPILRLAYLVRLGSTCRILGIGSAKLDFGTAKLAGPAFSALTGVESWSHDAANYVLCGRFDADIGSHAMQEPTVLRAVLAFRYTQEGSELRKEIFQRLQLSEGGEAAIAINGGLQRAIPTHILQKAHDQFVRFFASPSAREQIKPIIWNDARYSDEKALSLWRKRSYAEFTEICSRLGIGRYDRCPCGSGEKLKFCCEEALRD